MNSFVNIKVISSLEKIYHDDKVPENALSYFSMLKNEKKSFQIAVESEKDIDAELIIKSNFNDVRVYSVEHIKSDFPMFKGADDYNRYSNDKYYPDLLLPVNEKVRVTKGISVFWVEISANEQNIGTNTIKIELKDSEKIVGETSLEVEVIDCNLDFKDFVYTNWFHTDCLMSHYGFDAFSNEYWRVTENFLKTANEYGMNCVLTPIFTPPLDTENGKERPTVQLVDVTLNNGIYSFNFEKLSKWI